MDDMRNWGKITTSLALATLALSGCGSEPAAESSEPTVSAECTAAFEEMKAAKDKLHAEGDYTDQEINDTEVPPLEDCSSVDEWMMAAKANPASLGLTDASVVNGMALQLRCYFADVKTTPVCQDAKEQGMLDEYGTEW